MPANDLDLMIEGALAAEPAETEAPEAETTETTGTEATTEETTTEEAPAAEASAEPQAPAAPAAPAPATTEARAAARAAAKAEEEAIFDEKALGTKEGLLAARKWAQAKRAEWSSRDARLETKQAALTRKVKEFAAERDATRTERERAVQFSQRMQGALTKLTSGNAQDILTTLGELTGKEPAEVYREISHLMATNGKSNGKTSPETEALRAELAGLKGQLEARAKAEEEAAVQVAMDRIYSVAVSSNAEAKANYPHIARCAAASTGQAAAIREHLAELKIKMHNAGTPLSDEEAAQSLESELAQLVASSSPQSGTSGQAPASGQAPPTTKPPKSLTSKDRSAPAQRRERADETIEEMAKDSSLMGAIFG